MIEIEPGQHVVIASARPWGSYTTVRADSATARQIRTRRHGSSYSVTERYLVVFAGDKGKAELVADALNKAKQEWSARNEASKAQFEVDCQPARDMHDTRLAESRARYDADRKQVLAAAGVQVPA